MRPPRLLFTLVLLICFGRAAQAQYDPDWSRHFRLGAMAGFNIKADFRMAAGQNAVTGARPGPVGKSRFDHFYDDGYVLVDNTRNARGLTSYYGFDNASQNVANQQLLMHSTSSFTGASGALESDDKPLPGFELAYGGNFLYWKRFRIGWDFGFGLLPVNLSADAGPGPGTGVQSVYSFAVPEGEQLPMTLPYRGGPSGQGSVIHDIATLAGVSNGIPGAVFGSQKLDVMLYMVRLGPSVYWDFNRWVGMSISAGPAMGIVSGDLEFDQTFVASGATARSRGKASGTDLVYGGYANASVFFHLVRNGDLFLGAQYMPLGDAAIRGAGHEGRLKLGGAVYVSGGINWPF